MTKKTTKLILVTVITIAGVASGVNAQKPDAPLARSTSR